MSQADWSWDGTCLLHDLYNMFLAGHLKDKDCSEAEYEAAVQEAKAGNYTMRWFDSGVYRDRYVAFEKDLESQDPLSMKRFKVSKYVCEYFFRLDRAFSALHFAINKDDSFKEAVSREIYSDGAPVLGTDGNPLLTHEVRYTNGIWYYLQFLSISSRYFLEKATENLIETSNRLGIDSDSLAKVLILQKEIIGDHPRAEQMREVSKWTEGGKKFLSDEEKNIVRNAEAVLLKIIVALKTNQVYPEAPQETNGDSSTFETSIGFPAKSWC